MSDVDHKLHYNDRERVADPTDDELNAIWDEFTEFYLTQHTSRLHLFENCHRLNDKQSDETREKDVACFPVGFKPVCSWCVREWRNNDE